MDGGELPRLKDRMRSGAGRRAVVASWAGPLVVAVLIVVSRFVYRAWGVRFDSRAITEFSQLLDPFLLENRLLESLFYLHAQPPLYNLLTGVALKLNHAEPERVLVPVFWLASAYLAGCLYFLSRRFHVPRAVALACVTFMAVSPAWVLYENWYFYPHLNVTWLAGTFAWLAASRGKPGRSMLLAAAHLAGLVLTRSLFHPLFYCLFALVALVGVERGRRLRALGCFLLPGLLVLAVTAKNFALFELVGTSSWGSRNFCHATMQVLGQGRIDAAEEDDGPFTPAVHTTWFETGDKNLEIFKLKRRGTGIPALDQVQKATATHQPNFNHYTYPKTQKFYLRDALRLIETYPVDYVRGLAHVTFPTFFLPVSHGYFFDENRDAIPKLTRWFDRLEGSVGLRLFVALGLALALRRACLRSCPYAERLVVASMLFVMAWVFFVGVIGEEGENYRFRYKVLWLSWVLALGGYVPVARRLGRSVRLLLPERNRPR